MDAAEVKVEEFDGTYACVICSESVRGGDALHCAQCSSNPVHVACVRGSPFAETCAQCSGKTMRPWTGRAGGGAPSSATIDLVAAEAEPAASGKGKEILDDADEDSDAGGSIGMPIRGAPVAHGRRLTVMKQNRKYKFRRDLLLTVRAPRAGRPPTKLYFSRLQEMLQAIDHWIPSEDAHPVHKPVIRQKGEGSNEHSV